MKIKTALFDIDGVLTDGMVYIDKDGNETKRISFADIDAVFELKRKGVKIGFITGEDNKFSKYVQERFSPDFFISGCRDKLSCFKELAEKYKIETVSACFAGDSPKDAELLQYLNITFAPANSHEEARKSAKFITRSSRGDGVIREVAQFILNGNASEEFKDNYFRDRIGEHINVIEILHRDKAFYSSIHESAKVLVETFKAGGKLLICGNGGSAADSQHIATELVSRFFMERRALDAEALTVNTSSLTAIGNDYSFDNVFSRQVEAKGKKGDVLMAITTSGNSKNIIEAVKAAKSIGMYTIGLTGKNKECALFKASDLCICVPSASTPRIQEAHILIGHIMCEFIEKELFS